ncbi:MAG: MiaB/RimO family radical SAM methylthiotransferase, partial [Clostridia bacterium]|nr:MiaB/RimO family radical SAM methylthiotransferase [Clostridia bacterium]
RAFVKIQDGCNSFCSYCFVPLVRGRVRSRSLEDVFSEVSDLSKNGYREIVLTGIETGAWGEDFDEKKSLCDLVESISVIDGIERIRFGSLKPSVFTEDFCLRLSKIKKVLPHFHLSLQSGSSRVLSLMKRRYDREEEEKAIQRIYRYFPDAGLSADLICGFPGETEEDFQDTVSLVKNAKLLHTHIFPFSPREGTLAAKMSPVVPENIKKVRCAELLQVAKEESISFAEKRQGKTYRVLCERVRDGFMLGYTENFIYTKTPVDENIRIGDCFDVVLGKEKEFSVETMTVFAQMARNS